MHDCHTVALLVSLGLGDGPVTSAVSLMVEKDRLIATSEAVGHYTAVGLAFPGAVLKVKA